MDRKIVKPTQLTSQFVRLVHEGVGNHTGFFQLVEYHQKRQKYYSTHISDGYFKCKCIMREKPSKQIERGDIKLFSILYGTVSNQGNRLLLVIGQLLYWDFPRTIGIIRSWKVESPNTYINGSNFIQWASQPGDDQDLPLDLEHQSAISTISMSSHCASQMPLKSGVQNQVILSNRKVSSKFGQQIKARRILMGNTFSFGSHAYEDSQTGTIDTGINNKSGSREQFQRTQSLNMQSTKQSKVKSETSKKQPELVMENKNSKRLMVVPESQSQHTSNTKSVRNRNFIEEIPQRLSEAFSKDETSLKVVSSVVKQSNKGKKNEPKSKISYFFDDDEDQTGPEIPNADEEDDELYELMDQLKKVKQERVNQMFKQSAKGILLQSAGKSPAKKQPPQYISNKKKTTLQQLLSLDGQSETTISQLNKQNQQTHQAVKIQSKTPAKPYLNIQQAFLSSQKQSSQLQLKQILLQSQQKANSLYSIENQIKANDISITSTGKNTAENSCRKWVTVRILCSKFIQEHNLTKKLCVAEQFSSTECGNIFNMLLTNADLYNPFEDGTLYQLSLSNAMIVEPTVEQMFVQMEIRANSQTIKARKLPPSKSQHASSSHFCYIGIQRIESVREGVSINIVGIVSKYKNISNKKKGGAWTNIFTIIDYESGATVDFTIFDVHKLTAEPNSPAVVYNAVVKNYQGKKTLNFRNYTLYYFGKEALDKFAPYIPQLRAIEEWLLEGNTVGNIVSKLEKFTKLDTLLQAESLAKHASLGSQEMNVQIQACRVTKVSPYFFILICDACNKKLGKTNSCFSCGRRQSPLKEYQLSIQVSDNTHSFYIEFNHYDSMGHIGQEGEKYHQFCQLIMHRWVRLWLVMNPRYRAIVVRMELLSQGDLVAKEWARLRSMLRFI